MRKEVIFAILIGLGFGLFITYGVYQARLALSRPADKPDIEQNISPTPNEIENGKLTILSPENESVQAENQTTVSGTTLPENYVVVFINDEGIITTADQSGNFAIEVELENGSNVIEVYALDEDGHSTLVERIVIVSDDPLTTEAENKTETEEATESSQTS